MPLKLHPREQERPRALIARAERLYAATTGGPRQYVLQVLSWYQSMLNRQDPLLAAKASARVEQTLEQIEAVIGTGEFSDVLFDPSLDDMEHEEEEL